MPVIAYRRQGWALPHFWQPLLLLLAAVALFFPAAASGARIERTVNRDWTFNYFPSGKLDEGVARPEFEDRTWPAVALPHSWSTFETTGDLHPFIKNASERDDPYWWRGWGWYRKRFTLDPRHRGAKVFLELDGVQKYARVYLNGKYLGEHKGGYTSFSLDLTGAVRLGGENLLAIAVSNRRDDAFGGIPPMTAGNFNVYGGIYRDVRLVLKDRLHIPFQGSADHEGGTFVTTPEVSAERGIVRVRTWVRNDHDSVRTAELVTRVLDPDGREIARLLDRRRIEPGATAQFDQTSGAIAKPRLWSPDTPHLYRVISEVRDGARLVDRTESPLGFRWFRWDEDAKRLVLNGRPILIRGTNRHQEYPWLGDAIPKRLHAAELQEIRRALGHNFMRAAHYPNDQQVYRLADELGLIMVEEVPNIKSIDFSEEVQDRNLVEMIRRDRNHPSILFWSVGNETSDAADSCLAKREDPTRLVHQRKSEGYGACVDHDHEDLDLENLLRVTIRGWSDTHVRNLTPENGQSAGTETWQHQRARIDNGSIRGRLDRQMVGWLYADHGADREYENAPLKHVNAKGWVDLYRVPKYLYYLTQANWTDRPMVFVHPHHWRAEAIGQRRDFQVDSNCAEVELSVNGRAIGRRRPTTAGFRTVRFEGVRVERGRLAARCLDHPGVEHMIVMAGAPARLVLAADQRRLLADRSDVAIITADIVDADGVHVIGATHPLTWEVMGPGRLVGAAKYETDIGKVMAMEGTGYIETPVKNIVRSTATPGTIRVRVSSPGLAPAELELVSVAAPASSAEGIGEPPLTDSGRAPVVRDSRHNAVADALADAPVLARIEDENHSFPKLDDAQLRAAIDAFIQARNPNVDRSTPAYGVLLTRLVDAVKRTDRQLIPDDYNFAIANYNDAARLSRFLDATKLHPEYRRLMQRHYADLLVARGRPLDWEAEQRRLAPLLEGARLVRIVAPAPGSTPLAATYDNVTDHYRVSAATVEEMLTRLYPEFASWSAAAKARAVAYVVEANPQVLRSGTPPPIGQPILVPSLTALKEIP